ncbi:fructan beta-fructosidase [Evansella caseinilytica]|uniref:Fructan beta-fructosidase n=1 Tax=Evansella caseinilytica TaxID=1503961 RepID=A0A1H3USB1_9BACI|nr:fructan beta-fructosidase [Evansella caseinilytica]
MFYNKGEAYLYPLLAVMSCFVLVSCSYGQGNGGMVMEHEARDNYYIERYRPQFHFSTPVGNLADPNGLVYFEGEYHLFHQKNGMWAHAISEDLIHWQHQDIALDHDELGQALSGSVVVDWKNSTGFFDRKPGLVAIYTSTHGGEAQSLAYSKDKGRTWTRYEGNPVIENPGIKDFRDPKVFWHEETDKWVMVVSTDKSVTFYHSDNLIDWEYQSQFGEGHGTHAAVWECPDLFRLPVDGDKDNQKWVLHVSVGDNEETNGSTAQYFIGDFDGTQFFNENPPETTFITDFGQDFYAAQSFSDMPVEDGRRIWLGWMANWRYPYQSPTEPWMGSMSIPRELELRTTADGAIKLFQKPIAELKSLRATDQQLEPFSVEGNHKLESFSGTNFEFEATIAWEQLDEFGIRLRKGRDEETTIGVQVKENKVFLDRSHSGLEEITDRNGEIFLFGQRYQTDYTFKDHQIKIHGIVDESSVEVFFDDGEAVFTNLIYTNPTNAAIEFYTKGGEIAVTDMNIYHLHTIWRKRGDKKKIERIVLSDEQIEMSVGETQLIHAAAKPDWYSDENFIWKVADPKIADIEGSGKEVTVSGKKAGLTNVVVTDESGKVTAELSVKVNE